MGQVLARWHSHLLALLPDFHLTRLRQLAHFPSPIWALVISQGWPIRRRWEHRSSRTRPTSPRRLPCTGRTGPWRTRNMLPQPQRKLKAHGSTCLMVALHHRSSITTMEGNTRIRTPRNFLRQPSTMARSQPNLQVALFNLHPSLRIQARRRARPPPQARLSVRKRVLDLPVGRLHRPREVNLSLAASGTRDHRPTAPLG